MDAWLTVAVALIVAFSTLGATWLQNRQSNKRFEKELQKAKDDAQRQRSWEVRSEPLLELRDELAVMATKLKKLVIDTRAQHYRSNITEEENNKELAHAVEDLKGYLVNEDFLQAINLQYDAELLQVVDNIISSYCVLFEYAQDYKSLKLDLLKEFRNRSKETETKTREAQEAIYKRLENL